MAYEFKLPDVGEGMQECEVIRLHVKEGQRVEAYAPFIDVQTDKASVEIPSPVTGIVTSLFVKEGKVAFVDSTIAWIEEAGTEGRDEQAPPQDPGLEGGETGASQKRQTGVKEPTPERVAAGGRRLVLALPSVRRLARELGVDLSEVRGTGKQGRILAGDVERAREQGASPVRDIGEKESTTTGSTPVSPPPSSAPPLSARGHGKLGQQMEEGIEVVEEIEPLRGIRKVIAQRMVESVKVIPHVTLMDEWDAVELVSLRREVQDLTGSKITYLPFFIKAVLSALRSYPHVNACLDMEREEIIVKKKYHMGIAVATEAGLMVPVIRDVDRKTLLELAAEVSEKAIKGRELKLESSDLRDGTFTITSLGSMGGSFFTPIIAHPQVAILGVGAMKEKPVARDGQVVIRRQVPISLSFDHRLVDGDVAARFLSHMRERIEQPKHLLMEMR
ncbi:dihydrolipoamide acetyltransferase family protein [Pasteuria penetrans]|uniref:dihydrolipoamide acetyltransferase family protein n=1 Tax=Pasteuria penetrans TaxID=86005 RepID=UPI000F9D26F5|nr:dihydrolipoamide acetyltransferase family protein [Pasteuria penetrans]